MFAQNLLHKTDDDKDGTYLLPYDCECFNQLEFMKTEENYVFNEIYTCRVNLSCTSDIAGSSSIQHQFNFVNIFGLIIHSRENNIIASHFSRQYEYRTFHVVFRSNISSILTSVGETVENSAASDREKYRKGNLWSSAINFQHLNRKLWTFHIFRNWVYSATNRPKRF